MKKIATVSKLFLVTIIMLFWASTITVEAYGITNQSKAVVSSYIATNIQSIVPQGTSVDNIPLICANYISNIMEYDYTKLSIEELWKYENPVYAFVKGKGICSTYSLSFNELVSSVPVNQSTGIVDYNICNPAYLTTAYMIGNTSDQRKHAWSAVNMYGVWREYDVTYYDGIRDIRWLNMSAETMNDGFHMNPIFVTNY